jgi:hypothetical protein
MLTSTFVHTPGIGYTTERKIWENGAHTWAQFLEMHSSLGLPDGKRELLLQHVEESIGKLEERDHAFFAKALRSRDHWRAAGEFGNEIAYIDIETTGCGWDDQITVIGLYDGYDMRAFVRGINLDGFPKAVSGARLLVTFFGSGFDLPFIHRTFPDLRLDQLHVDLCFLLRRLGFSGGLKSVEQRLGIIRGPETEGLDGFDAVRLWHEYRRASSEALEKLLLYNKEDVMNMEPLLQYGCAEMEKLLALP